MAVLEGERVTEKGTQLIHSFYSGFCTGIPVPTFNHAQESQLSPKKFLEDCIGTSRFWRYM